MPGSGELRHSGEPSAAPPCCVNLHSGGLRGAPPGVSVQLLGKGSGGSGRVNSSERL